jgi:hypothetical protein
VRFLASIALRVADEAVGRVLRNLDERIKQLTRIPILDGVLISDVVVTTSGVTVGHGLGRVPVGCIIVKTPANVAYTTDEFTKTQLDVTCSSGTRTVNLWVF